MPEFNRADRLGKAIALNDFVAYPSRNELEIGKIIKITKKMVRVALVDTKQSTTSSILVIQFG